MCDLYSRNDGSYRKRGSVNSSLAIISRVIVRKSGKIFYTAHHQKP